jgi:hypothetical protein
VNLVFAEPWCATHGIAPRYRVAPRPSRYSLASLARCPPKVLKASPAAFTVRRTARAASLACPFFRAGRAATPQERRNAAAALRKEDCIALGIQRSAKLYKKIIGSRFAAAAHAAALLDPKNATEWETEGNPLRESLCHTYGRDILTGETIYRCRSIIFRAPGEAAGLLPQPDQVNIKTKE